MAKAVQQCGGLPGRRQAPKFQPKLNHHISGCWEVSLPRLEARDRPQGELPIQSFPVMVITALAYGGPGSSLSALHNASYLHK